MSIWSSKAAPSHATYYQQLAITRYSLHRSSKITVLEATSSLQFTLQVETTIFHFHDSKRAPVRPLRALFPPVLKFTLPNEIMSKMGLFLRKIILNPNHIQFSVLIRRSKNKNLSYSEVAEAWSNARSTRFRKLEAQLASVKGIGEF